MLNSCRFAAVAAAIAFTSIGVARADDAHHPPESAQSAQPGITAQPPSPGNSTMRGGQEFRGQGMAGMGQGAGGAMMTRDMMGMMMQMHTQVMAMGGIANHVEGRIAFLRTELKIGSNQQEAWNGFADALRTNAKQLSALRNPQMMGASASLQEQFERQEKLATAQLQGLTSMKAAYQRLAGVLSDEQKMLAAQLIPPHVGLMPRMM
jgi:hypothetical protein